MPLQSLIGVPGSVQSLSLQWFRWSPVIYLHTSSYRLSLGGGCKQFFFSPLPAKNDPIWPIFFNGVETTNYIGYQNVQLMPNDAILRLKNSILSTTKNQDSARYTCCRKSWLVSMGIGNSMSQLSKKWLAISLLRLGYRQTEMTWRVNYRAGDMALLTVDFIFTWNCRCYDIYIYMNIIYIYIYFIYIHIITDFTIM